MPLIPIDKELRIKALLKEELSLRQIAKEVGVAPETVRRVKQAPGLRVRVPRSSRRLRVPKRCDSCGAGIDAWPCPNCCPEEYRYDDLDSTLPVSRVVIELSPSEVQSVVEIVKDLIELQRLNLIHHPLFLSLAERAEIIVKELLTREEHQGATKKAA